MGDSIAARIARAALCVVLLLLSHYSINIAKIRKTAKKTFDYFNVPKWTYNERPERVVTDKKRALSSGAMNEREKFGARWGDIAEASFERRSNQRALLFLDAPANHAEMLRLDHNADPDRAHMILNR
jgi:hypothetical protein